MSGPAAALLADGRLHLQHGPIDLVIGASGAGAGDAARRAYQAAVRRFRTVLEELVVEIGALRRPCPPEGLSVRGAIARRMERAVRPHARSGRFVTPMAAVAGSVAEEVLEAMRAGAPLRRAYVNNGGDIALHLEDGERYRLACVAPAEAGRDPGCAYAAVSAGGGDGVGGVATSGRRGRSFSLGFADSVTAVAASAPAADAAATLIGNAVDLPGHPAVARRPARELDPDSDLGERLVVTGLARLSDADIIRALANGVETARRMRAAGEIIGAAILLEGRVRAVGSGVELAGRESGRRA